MIQDGPAPQLVVDSVAKSFGALRVLDDVTFSVPAGQALGIVGPNGAGKSTLFSVISGVESADTGSVHISGQDVTHRGAAQRCRFGVGRTFQIPRPFVDLTVFENALVGAQRGAGLRGRAAHDRALAALASTGLTKYANDRAGTLRLLDRKRLELARALATEPRLLLLDEIAGGLTEAETTQLVATVLRLKADGLTIIWIEHVVNALTQVVDRLLCLAFGRVYVDGLPDEVMASQEVEEIYLGSTPK